VEALDQEARVLFANAAYAKTFLDAAVSLGERTQVLPETMPDGTQRSGVLNAAMTQGLWKGETVLTTNGSRRVCFRVTVFPIRDSDDEVEFGVFYEDIQREIETREALVQQQNLVAIRSRQAQMGELLSMIAHQWRQPLTVVMSLIGNIQLKAQMGGVTPDYLTGKLDRISQTVHFLSETIDSFRNFYAPTKFKTEEDLGALSQRALDLLRPSLEKVQAKVEFQVADAPPKVRVFSGELVQVALELITNARNALLAGHTHPPMLRLEVTRDQDWAVLCVANNGAAIPPEEMPHIYDPYYTTKDGSPGTGLGLYMAKLIVENHHGGELSATSDGTWTRFTCRLPLEGAS
jgi:signal transduction histidine kinase